MTTATATATATAAPTTTTCIIRARDFSRRTTDVLRDSWTLGKMRHVIAALDGAPVVITTDRQTGHTLVGAKLLSCYKGWNGDRVLIESTLSDGTAHQTAYYLPSVGDTIVPLERSAAAGTKDAKRTALETYGREKSAAISYAQARHGEVEGRAWGEWEARPADGSVFVTYTPSTGNPAFADKWGTRGYWEIPVSAL